MKNRCDYWAALAIDMAAQCSVDATLDVAYVKQRVATEGDTFFMVTLPQFAKDLERSLEDHLVSPEMFKGFRRRVRPVTVGSKRKKIHGGVPEFLGNFTRQIFDDTPTLSWDEYLELQNASQQAGLPLGHLIPPMLRDSLRGVAKPAAEVFAAADAVAAVRQLCLAFNKEEEEPSSEMIASAVEGYKSTEQELLNPF